MQTLPAHSRLGMRSVTIYLIHPTYCMILESPKLQEESEVGTCVCPKTAELVAAHLRGADRAR